MFAKSTLALHLLLHLVLASAVLADPGVLIATNGGGKPDSSVLSLERMDLELDVRGRFATVKTVQVFRNRTAADLEGEYLFFLPAGTSLSHFAIWEDGVRIAGVVLERARARGIYEELTASKIDPGLLERTDDEAATGTFSVKVYPIPAHGSKRLEMEYTQELPLAGSKMSLAYPLKPARYRQLSAGRFSLRYRVESPVDLLDFHADVGALGAKAHESGPRLFTGSFDAEDYVFTGDALLRARVPATGTRAGFLFHRDPDRARRDLSPFGKGATHSDNRGYFLCDVTFDLRRDGPGKQANRPPLAVSILFDASLSMRWDKLDHAVRVLTGVLDRLGEDDRFSLALFNDRVAPFPGELQAADGQTRARAIDWIRSGSLAGGTDLLLALQRGLSPLEAAPETMERILMIIGDGRPTSSPLAQDELVEGFHEANRKLLARVMAFGVGSDSNQVLLHRLASESRGQFTWASETQDVAQPLEQFLERMRQPTLTGVSFQFDPPENFEALYPSGSVIAHDQSSLRFAGRYKGPLESASCLLSFTGPEGASERRFELSLPARRAGSDHLPRIWAKERVDYLLQRIEREGENDGWVTEIISLAKRFTFVTPYTSFLAAPRALLRPRIIKPGDPLIRVRTSDAIAAVVAILPFGEVKQLTYLKDEDIWETRFLVPRDLPDGTYEATLVLTDREGRKFLEQKSFVIDGKAPEIQVQLPPGSPAPGSSFLLRVLADQDTRRIRAQLPGLPPVPVVWDPEAKACVARVFLPPDYQAGSHTLQVMAEDFAHNVSFAQAELIVLHP